MPSAASFLPDSFPSGANQNPPPRWLLVGSEDLAKSKQQEMCLKAKVNRGKVKYAHKTGVRCYIAQTHVVKQDKYKDAPPTAIDLFKDFTVAGRPVSVSLLRKLLNKWKLSWLSLQKKGNHRRLPLKLLHKSCRQQNFSKMLALRQQPRRGAPRLLLVHGCKNLRLKFRVRSRVLLHLKIKLRYRRMNWKP